MVDHVIRLVGDDEDESELDQDAKDHLTFLLRDFAWETAFLAPDEIEWVEDPPSLSQQVGDLASDADADLTAYERSKLEEAAHLISRVEDE